MLQRKKVNMAKVVKISLLARDTDKVFEEGREPGEVATRTLLFGDHVTEKQMKSPMFLRQLIEQQEKMIEEQFRWKIERMDDE